MKKLRRRVLTPQTLFHGLARELELLSATYARLHTAHHALTPYPTLATLLERLTVGPRDDDKKRLLAALVVIRQSEPHRLWVSILLRAFRPMLAKLWKKLFGAHYEDRLALLVFSFQEGIRSLDAIRDPLRIGMWVRQATRRKVIDLLATEVEWGEVGFGEDPDEIESGQDPPFGQLRAVEKLLGRGALLAHVRETYPDLRAEERRRIYGNLRRALRKAVAGKPGSNDEQEVL